MRKIDPELYDEKYKELQNYVTIAKLELAAAEIELRQFCMSHTKERFYRVGQKFRCTETNVTYMLCRVDSVGRVSLINMENGNRWDDAIRVEDSTRITEEEFDRILIDSNVAKFVPIDD